MRAGTLNGFGLLPALPRPWRLYLLCSSTLGTEGFVESHFFFEGLAEALFSSCFASSLAASSASASSPACSRH